MPVYNLRDYIEGYLADSNGQYLETRIYSDGKMYFIELHGVHYFKSLYNGQVEIFPSRITVNGIEDVDKIFEFKIFDSIIYILYLVNQLTQTAQPFKFSSIGPWSESYTIHPDEVKNERIQLYYEATK